MFAITIIREIDRMVLERRDSNFVGIRAMFNDFIILGLNRVLIEFIFVIVNFRVVDIFFGLDLAFLNFFFTFVTFICILVIFYDFFIMLFILNFVFLVVHLTIISDII